MSVVSRHIQAAALLTVALIVHASQSQSSGYETRTTESQRGTCIVVAMRGSKMAVAADSRGLVEDDNGNLTVAHACKLRLATPSVLLGGTGVTYSEIVGTHHYVPFDITWDSLQAATDSAQSLPPNPTYEQMFDSAIGWQSKVQSFMDLHGFENTFTVKNGDELVSSEIMTVTGNHPVVMIARYLKNDDGFLVAQHPHSYSTANMQETLPGFWGRCDIYFPLSAGTKILSKSELARLKVLELHDAPKARTTADLLHLALRYEKLASDISSRIAREKRSIPDIAPPYSTATNDGRGSDWVFHPDPTCRASAH